MSEKIGIVATLRAVEGKGQEVVDAFRAALPAVENEKGTELYIVHHSPDEPDVVTIYELYTDKAAQDEHRSGEPLRNLGRALKGLLADAPTLTVIPVAAGKGI